MTEREKTAEVVKEIHALQRQARAEGHEVEAKAYSKAVKVIRKYFGGKDTKDTVGVIRR